MFVYAFDKSDQGKQLQAIKLLDNLPFISSQVIIETFNACHKKLKLSSNVCQEIILHLCNITRISNVDQLTIRSAIKLKNKYQFSFLDGMIVSTAIRNNCTILYSEDMHNGLLIENKLTIINPFLEKTLK